MNKLWKDRLLDWGVPAVILLVGVGLFIVRPRVLGQPASPPLTPAAERAPAPALALPDIEGRPWSLGQHRGRAVLLNYWATWCPPCREETPALVNVARSYEGDGLDVVGVSMDTGGAGLVRDFIREYSVPYRMVMAAEDPLVLATPIPLPTTLLIDREGRVAKSYIGAMPETVFRADIEQLLSER